MCTQEVRLAILANMNMDEVRKQSIFSDLAKGHCLFGDAPLPKDLAEVER